MEEGCGALGDIAEEETGEQVGCGPDDRAGEVPDKEASVGHAGLSGDGGGYGGEAGDELGEEEGYGTAAGEVALGAGDTGGGFE